MQVIDYGRSFVCTLADFNSPRFIIESRCRIIDDDTGRVEDYFQCASCKSERMWVERNLFQDDNHDYLPVFGAEYGIAFRRKAWLYDNYKTVYQSNELFGGQKFHLVTASNARILGTTTHIREATHACRPVVARTQIRHEGTHLRAIIECPVKTMNIKDDDDLYQVDTGPVIFPDLTKRRERFTDGFSLAFVAFNAPDYADFVIETPTPVTDDGLTRVHHYSQRSGLPANNTLYSHD